MKQKILVTLLIIETVILAFVLLGKGASENKIAQNLGENNTNTSWDVSGETEIFREESPAENAGLSEDRENVVTVDEKRVIQEQSFNIEWKNGEM